MLKNFFISILFLSFGTVVIAQQGSSEELRRQQAEIQKEINELKETLKATQKNKKASLGELAMVQKKLRLREQAIDNISDQINLIQGTINQSRSEINKLRMELDTLKVQYEKSVVYAYKNRSNYDFLNFIFSAASFNDAVKRVEYLKTYRNYRQQQAENIRNTQTSLHQKIASLEETKKVKDEVLHKQEKEKMVLVDERKEKDEVVSKLKAREKEITKELTAKAKNDRLLRNSISVAVKREMDKARAAAAAADAAAKKAEAATPKAPVTTNATNPVAVKPTRAKSVLEATPEGAIISADFEKNKGKLPWPVENANVKIHFGLYSIEGQNVKGNNPGLTIETNEGGQVKAVFDGEVVYIFDVDGTTTVMVRHGKYFTTYGNLANVAVSKGQKVTVGQRIGKVTNNNDGNGELEFLIMQENHEVNPEAWLRRK